MRFIKNNNKLEIFTLEMLKLNEDITKSILKMVVGEVVIISNYALKRLE